MIHTGNVIETVIVAALENGNDIVGVIDTVDARGSLSFAGIATMRSGTRLRALASAGW